MVVSRSDADPVDQDRAKIPDHGRGHVPVIFWTATGDQDYVALPECPAKCGFRPSRSSRIMP
jgi:hypothetical protein